MQYNRSMQTVQQYCLQLRKFNQLCIFLDSHENWFKFDAETWNNITHKKRINCLLVLKFSYQSEQPNAGSCRVSALQGLTYKISVSCL